MRLRADIISEGIARHVVWDATVAAVGPVRRPVTAEIVEESGGAFLLRLSESGDCVADTWHEDVAAAKAQAAFEYGITDEAWVTIF